MVFYLLLGYITFKELSNKKASFETYQRILLKWMTSAVFFSSFWIFETIFYFIPTSFIKLPLGLWILLPQFFGEYTIYNMFYEGFDKLEYYFRDIRNVIASALFGITFSISTQSFAIIKKFVPTDKLKDFQNQIRGLDKELNDELRLRKQILQQMTGKDPMSKKNVNEDDLRDSTVVHHGKRKQKEQTYYRPPTGQIYTPVGLFTRTPSNLKASSSVLETSGTNITEENEDEGIKKSRTSVKKNKFGKQNSNDDRDSLGNLGKASSYIDPKLLQNRRGMEDIEFVDREEYQKLKDEAKKYR